MIGSDLTSLKDMLSNVFTRAAAAKEKASDKTADKTAGKPARTDASDPAFLLSANLQDSTGRLRGLAEGASDGAKDGVARADEALDQLSGVLEYTGAFAEQLDGVMEAMGRDLGRMLTAFGLGDEEVGEAVRGFTDRFGKDERRKAAAEANKAVPAEAYAVSRHAESTAVAVEVSNIELTLEQGGKTLTLSFERSSLSLSHSSESAYAAGDGRSSVMGVEQSAASLSARSESFTLKADGFSAEELDGIMKSLQGAMTGAPQGLEGGLEGQAALTPRKGAEGEPLRLSLDLKGLLTSAFGERGGRAAEILGKDIERQGFDVRV